jgi:hypothetical protein
MKICLPDMGLIIVKKPFQILVEAAFLLIDRIENKI